MCEIAFNALKTMKIYIKHLQTNAIWDEKTYLPSLNLFTYLFNLSLPSYLALNFKIFIKLCHMATPN